MTVTPDLALCGHATCDPFRSRNSILDSGGDVVLYHACDGRRWLFRDSAAAGMLAEATSTGWTLTVADHVEVSDGRWDMVVRGQPSATITYDGVKDWAAHRQPSGRVFARKDTQWGALAAVARAYLRIEPASTDVRCPEGECDWVPDGHVEGDVKCIRCDAEGSQYEPPAWAGDNARH